MRTIVHSALLVASLLFSALLLAAIPAAAGEYVQQATFSVNASAIAGMDRDSVGNLYVLQLPPGGTYYTVTGYRTPAMEPLFSFDTGARAPLAFAVEPSGVVDVLDGYDGFTLRRFLNTGYFLGQSTFSLGAYISTSSLSSAAIDKVGGRVLLAYQTTVTYYCVQQVGVSCPPGGLKGNIMVYDFTGAVVGSVVMSGISSTAGSCYTPTKIAVGLQRELVIADASCQQVLRYSPEGTLESQTPSSRFGYLQSLRAIWLDADSSLYLSQVVCGAAGCPWSVMKVSADGSPMGTSAADSTAGAAWDGRILYLTSAGRPPIRRLVYNQAPTVPAPSAPLGPVVQHSSAAWLRWQAATDGDGDPLVYSVEIGTFPFALRSTGTAESPEFTTTPLSFGTTYYWRVTVGDSYLGLPLQSRASSIENFVLGRVNAPPAAFSVLKGTGSVLTRDNSVLLSWTPATDADGDVPVYQLSWRKDFGTTDLSTTTATSVLMSGLSFGATYFWSVRAIDAYQAESLMNGGSVQSYVPVLRNTPPSSPVYVSTTAISTRETRYELRWLESEDEDGDPVSYRLYLATAAAALALVQEGPLTSYPIELSYGTTLYWRVVAVDTVGGVADSGTRTFTATFLNDPPDPLRLSAPFMTAPTIKTMRDGIEVSWQRVTNPQGDPISYTAYLGGSPLDLAQIARVEQAAGALGARAVALGVRPQAEAQEDGDTVRLRLTGLDYYRDYYFKVTAENPYGAASQSPLQAFSLAAADSFPRVYNYPNPFSPNRGGTNVVFNAPSSGYSRAVLTVYSEFGQKLYERDCGRVAPGISEVRFDGRDQHGRALPNGSYVGRVRFDGPSETATFFLLVVK